MKGNLDKSRKKHGVTPNESEEVFLDERLLVVPDVKHGEKEERLIAVGKTFSKKILFIVFTVRGQKIRIISARTANKKERILYEARETKEDSEV